MPIVYRIQPRTTTRLRRNARYLGNEKRKKRRLKNKVKRYLNKKKFRRHQRRKKTVIKQTLPAKIDGTMEYVVTGDNYFIVPTFNKYEIGAKEISSDCGNLPTEFIEKWDSYFYHRLYRLSWKIDQIQGWIYKERTRGTDPNEQHFVEHYKLHEVPIIFVRDKIGGATGLGQQPNVQSQYRKTRCITNCHQKY